MNPKAACSLDRSTDWPTGRVTHRPFSRASIQCLQRAVLRLALRCALALLGFSSAQLGTLRATTTEETIE